MQSESQTLPWKVYPKFKVPEVTKLPDSISETPVSIQLIPIGGTAPYNVQVTNLPVGVTCSPEGLIEGMAPAGDFAPVFTWYDSTPVTLP